MDRRDFLKVSGCGLGLTYLAPLGCVSVSKPAARPRFSGVGERHLVFDGDSVEFELDPRGHRILGLDDAGRVETTFGQLGDEAGHLNHPVAAVHGPKGRLYVLEHGNNRVQVFDPSGTHVASFGESELNHPKDLAIDASGHLYVADSRNHRVAVFRADGTLVRSIGQFGNDERGEFQVDPTGLNAPRALAITPSNELHVVDRGNVRVQVYGLEGEHRFSYSGYGRDEGEMVQPTSIACDDQGRLSIGDPATGFIHVFAGDGEFLDRFRPQDADGNDAVPKRLERAPGGAIYVWTGGETPHPRNN